MLNNPLPASNYRIEVIPRRDEHDLRLLLDSSLDVICSFDREGRFLYTSAAAKEIWGYEPDELIGRKYIELVHIADREKTLIVQDALLTGEIIKHYENRYIKKDGSVVEMVWSARWDKKEQKTFCVARDATQKKEAEKKQKQYERRLNRAYRISKIGWWEWNVKDQTHSVSDEIYRIYGLSRERFPHITKEIFLSMVHPEDVKKVERHLTLISKRTTYEYEHRFIKPSGEVIYILQNSEVLRDENNNIIRVHGTAKDITETKKTQLRLEKSERKLTVTLENIEEAFVGLDTDWTVTYWNKQAEITLGKKRNEVLGRNLWALFPWEVGKRFYNECQSAVAQQQSIIFENYSSDFDIWFENKIYPSKDGISIFFKNINDQKQKEVEHEQYKKKIEEQNQMLVELLEQMRDGFLTLALDGTIISWNKEAERITGISRENTLGQSIWNLYPGLENTPYYQIFEKLLVDPSPIHEEVFSTFRHKWIELNAYKTNKGISVFFRDITSRKKAEEELKKLSLIAQKTNNPVIVQDSNRKIQWVNDAFTKISGYELEECIGKFIGDVCDGPQTSAAAIQYATEKTNNREPFRMEALNYKKNGETYWSDITCQPIFDENGEVIQYFSIATDITERKNLEKQLAREQKERQTKIAAATLKAQEEERSIVSQELHDNVNQVLTTVKLYTEMCRDGYGNVRETMEKSIKLLQDSINEIRSLSKRLSAPSLGKIKLTESVKELVDAVSDTKKLSIRLDSEGIELLDVDQEVHLAIYRILQEHLTNILKHADASNVQITLDFLMGHLYLKIKDDGKGFDPKRKSNGIGITNMITRAESLKGSLTIESEPGKGCVLAVSIPLDQNIWQTKEL